MNTHYCRSPVGQCHACCGQPLIRTLQTLSGGLPEEYRVNMKRRRIGVALLGVAMLVVLVSVAVQPRRVAGTAQAMSAPGPPSVGDCVPDPVDPTTWPTNPYVYPQLRFEACDQFRFGEVIAVLDDPAEPSVANQGGASGPVHDPNPEACLEKSDSYDGGVTQFRYWSPRIFAFAAPISPSPLQQAVGQHWVACAMFIPAIGQTDVRHYQGTLRNAFFTGNQRDVLGFCGAGRDWTKGYVSACSLPHEFQVLASGIVGGGDVSRDELRRTCVQVAERLTALPDVTAAGALAVEVRSIENTGASFASDGEQVEAKLGCGISTVGTRQLAGSLVALGDHPIPWAA